MNYVIYVRKLGKISYSFWVKKVIKKGKGGEIGGWEAWKLRSWEARKLGGWEGGRMTDEGRGKMDEEKGERIKVMVS